MGNVRSARADRPDRKQDILRALAIGPIESGAMGRRYGRNVWRIVQRLRIAGLITSVNHEWILTDAGKASVLARRPEQDTHA